MRRKLYPMPVEGLVDNPDLLAMPAAGAGIVLRLALHFWQTECRPLPSADHELRAIARAHTPTWRHWKASVLKVMAEIEPDMLAYWRLRETKGTTLRIAGRKAGEESAARSRAKVLSEASPSPSGSMLPALEANAPSRPVKRPEAKVKVQATMTDRIAA
jgi:hypothetical protein